MLSNELFNWFSPVFVEKMTTAMLLNARDYEAYIKQLAVLRKKTYDAYITEGFSPEEALVLCQTFRI